MHKFEPSDHSQHLADLLAQLYQLETLVKAGNPEAVSRLAMDMDWHTVADEFELVVAQHCYGVEHYARRLIRNVFRPYIQRHDCVGLLSDSSLLDDVLAESPSLHADADGEVAASWQHQVERAALRHHPVRDMPPITTLEGLRQAVAAKIALGRALEGSHPGFDGGERIPYDQLAQPGTTVPQFFPTPSDLGG